MKDQSFDWRNIAIWWCFFCNNQYRLLQDETLYAADGLITTFEDTLKKVGAMIIILDSFYASTYTSRMWCIYELCTASQMQTPCVVILPEHARNAYKQELFMVSSPDEKIKNACAIYAEDGRATRNADRNAIKSLLLKRHGSFEKVNDIGGRKLYCHFSETKGRLEDVVWSV